MSSGTRAEYLEMALAGDGPLFRTTAACHLPRVAGLHARGDSEGIIKRMSENTLTGDVVIVPPAGWHAHAPAQWREGRQVVPYTSMAEARQHPDTALVIKAEDGEQQVLLTCPLHLVAAGETSLQRLARDLCRLFVWEVFVADDHDGEFGTYSLYFVPLTPGDVVKGRGIGGPMIDGLWLDPELEHHMLLRPRIEEVLSGRLARMALPSDYPMDLEPISVGLRP